MSEGERNMALVQRLNSVFDRFDFVMLRDGAMVAGCLSEPDAVCSTFLDGVEGLLWSRTVAGAPS